VKTDKTKLFWLFHDKAYSMAGSGTVEENKEDWQAYLKNLGLEIVFTPDGLLPFHSPHFVHVPDPWHSPGREYHIQVPRETALRILAIGLP